MIDCSERLYNWIKFYHVQAIWRNSLLQLLTQNNKINSFISSLHMEMMNIITKLNTFALL